MPPLVGAVWPPPVLVVRPDVVEAVEARVDLVATDAAPAGASPMGPGTTVTEAGSGSHSEDMWNEPRCKLRWSA